MTNLLDLYYIADQEGIVVDCFDLKKREALSLMDDGVCYIAIDPFKLTSNLDEKAKLAHELGHCMTGSFYNEYAPLDERDRNEARANRWAIKQIVPFDALNDAVTNGVQELCELAECFDVSEEFIRQAIDYYTGPCGLSFQKILPEDC